ncbi:MAG: D-alanyl-D-alanine carboxypeptidase family protein [Acutalibacteraceae bacterium]|jgi:D-alanyl-D-alanine carboxypeptidase (penicillin-binding protein 5/6)
MGKRIFSFVFAFFLIISLFVPINASAYAVTGFEITAKAGMLVSLDTGEMLYSNNIDKKVYPASITKIMTSILMLEDEKFNPDAKVTMTKSVLNKILGTGSSVSNLKAGEEITQRDLLYMVLMSSFGDTAYLAAEYYAGSIEAFVQRMNEKAQELNLKNTHYTNPIGLHDEQNYTTVRDIYTLTVYALQNKLFSEVCSASRYKVGATNMSPERTISTTIFLQDTTTNYYYQFAKGVKTGYTDEAGRCLVSTASYNGYNYMCILMGCPPKADRRYEFVDSINLYRWAFNNFAFREIAKSNEPVCEIPVRLSMETDFVPLYFKKPFVSILPKDADDSTIVIEPHLNSDSVDAPVKKGEVLGTADVIFAEQVIGTVDLVAGRDVKSSTLLIAVDFVKRILSSVYMKLIYALIAVIVLVFIILCIRLNYSRANKRKVRYIPYKEKSNKGYDR